MHSPDFRASRPVASASLPRAEPRMCLTRMAPQTGRAPEKVAPGRNRGIEDSTIPEFSRAARPTSAPGARRCRLDRWLGRRPLGMGGGVGRRSNSERHYISGFENLKPGFPGITIPNVFLLDMDITCCRISLDMDSITNPESNKRFGVRSLNIACRVVF